MLVLSGKGTSCPGPAQGKVCSVLLLSGKGTSCPGPAKGEDWYPDQISDPREYPDQVTLPHLPPSLGRVYSA